MAVCRSFGSHFPYRLNYSKVPAIFNWMFRKSDRNCLNVRTAHLLEFSWWLYRIWFHIDCQSLFYGILACVKCTTLYLVFHTPNEIFPLFAKNSTSLKTQYQLARSSSLRCTNRSQEYSHLLQFLSEYIIGRNNFRIDLLIIKKMSKENIPTRY